MNMYSVFDSRTGLYNLPFSARSDGDASRMLIVSASSKESMLARFPEDYVLYRIGTFSEETGNVACEIPATVARLSTLLATQEPSHVA